MKARYLARYLLCFCLYYFGIVFLARTIRRWHGNHRVVILAYHSFSDRIRYLDMAVSVIIVHGAGTVFMQSL